MAGQSTSGLHRAVPMLPKMWLTVTRTRPAHGDVDLFVIVAKRRRESATAFGFFVLFYESSLFGSKLSFGTTLIVILPGLDVVFMIWWRHNMQYGNTKPRMNARSA